MILLALLLATSVPAATQPSTQPTFRKLVWSDEFDLAGKVDPSQWSFEHGFIRNNEAQYYTDRPENVRVENGSLIIEARREDFATRKPGHQAKYTSGSIETRGHFDFTYGRVECRAKLPAGRGTWPAIWMLGSNIDKVGWPACGEIDIMENVGFMPRTIHGTVHTKAYHHNIHTARGSKIDIDDPRDFHVYAIDWSPEKIDFFIDDHRYFTFNNDQKTDAQWPFDKAAFLKLNFAVGGEWGGQKGIDDTIFPQKFEVDYIRVYQQKPTASR